MLSLTLSTGSPSSRSTCRTSPAGILSMNNFVLTKFIGHATPRKSRKNFSVSVIALFEAGSGNAARAVGTIFYRSVALPLFREAVPTADVVFDTFQHFRGTLAVFRRETSQAEHLVCEPQRQIDHLFAKAQLGLTPMTRARGIIDQRMVGMFYAAKWRARCHT
jgi:hypothetical protein